MRDDNQRGHIGGTQESGAAVRRAETPAPPRVCRSRDDFEFYYGTPPDGFEPVPNDRPTIIDALMVANATELREKIADHVLGIS